METISIEDFRRIEAKVDKLTDAVGKLILFEERQATQGERITGIETKHALTEQSIQRVERKVDQWINRGIGVWAVVAVIFAIMELGAKLIK